MKFNASGESLDAVGSSSDAPVGRIISQTGLSMQQREIFHPARRTYCNPGKDGYTLQSGGQANGNG
jgi:hypothetical protein